MKFPGVLEELMQRYPETAALFTPEKIFQQRCTEHTARKLHQIVVEQNRPMTEWQVWQDKFIRRAIQQRKIDNV